MYVREDVLNDFALQIDLMDTDKIDLSNAEIVENQFGVKAGISCKGKLSRDYSNTQVSLVDYVYNTEYIGFKFEVDDISLYNTVKFHGKKIKDHGQPSVFVYNENGEIIAEFTEQYMNIDNEWHQYSIDISKLEGEVTIIFNGSYLDFTGSTESEYIFSNVILQ